MSGRPKLLDLFSGAGGAGEGYRRAGFDVTGVDHRPMPRNPHTFIQADALEYVAAHGHEYDAIHASPPCQAYSVARHQNPREHPDLVGVTRDLLVASGKPYVIENVVGAPLIHPVTLCGTMFGLGTGDAELRRHRLFELHGFDIILTPPCNHYARGNPGRVIGVYGGHGRDRRRTRPATVGVYGSAGGRSVRDGVQQFSTAERAEAMGIDWMTGAELSQAIPPAYTEFIGRQLMSFVMERVA